MKVEPTNFDRGGLASVLGGWNLSVTSLAHLPVGAGSHHYDVRDSDGQRWFVTVDRLYTKLFGMTGPTYEPWVEVDLGSAFDGLDRAFRTAVQLRGAGLEFVHAPITQPDGGVLARLGDEYAVSVFPFIEGAAGGGARPGTRISSGNVRRRVIEAVGRLHAATDAVTPGLPRRDSLTVPLRQRFLPNLDDLDRPWTAGPYSDAARLLLRGRTEAVRDMFDHCDELADVVRASDVPWVITHGQLHEANIVLDADGDLYFVDLDTLRVAPRERDTLWGGLVLPMTDDDWAAYTSAGQTREIDAVAVDLYSLREFLWAISTYTELFRSPHVDDPDMRKEWGHFQENVDLRMPR